MTTPGNLDRIRSELQNSDFDAVVSVAWDNTAYAAGTFIATSRTIHDRLAITVWAQGQEPTFIVCKVEADQAREESWIKDIRTYVEFHQSPIALLAEVLREKGADRGKIGIELGHLHARFYEDLKRELPGAALVSSERFFDRVRLVKTPGEIAILQEAAVATERALLATYVTIRPGETERSMKKRLIDNMLLCGADAFSFTYINAGPGTGYPHKTPGDYRCQAGDVIKTDAGGVWGLYMSDVARTGVVGKPSPQQADIWARLWEVHVQTIDKLRPGNKASDVFRAQKEGMERVGLPFPLPHAGHSIGLIGHEYPMLNAFNHTELGPNMCFMIETRVRWPGKEGYHVEDLILITESGPKWLTGTVFPNQHLLAI